MSAPKVTAFEKRQGIKLPADYKRFLRTTNGGCPEPNGFTVTERGDGLVGFLYGLRDEPTHGDLDWEQEQAVLWDPLPPGFVAIGHDPGNNKLLLGTLGENAGRVFFWDRVGIWVREDGHNTFPVAPSFTEFVASLREPPSNG